MKRPSHPRTLPTNSARWVQSVEEANIKRYQALGHAIRATARQARLLGEFNIGVALDRADQRIALAAKRHTALLTHTTTKG